MNEDPSKDGQIKPVVKSGALTVDTGLAQQGKNSNKSCFLAPGSLDLSC